jgi:hypothetical protein
LSIPYEWHFDEEKSVIVFSTSNGRSFEIKTTPVGDIYFSNLPFAQSISYELCFDARHQEEQGLEHDQRISLTIVDIVSAILLKGRIIVFVCESIDKRQKSRHKLFKRWFKKYGDKFEKYDVKVRDDTTTHYLSLLFDPKQQPSDFSISRAFQKSIDEYASYKNT